MKNLKITPISMVDYQNMQRIEIELDAGRTFHGFLAVYAKADQSERFRVPLACLAGPSRQSVMLPAPEEDTEVLWRIESREGRVLLERESVWKKPREWKIYIMISSHTDVGLHNSQYIQRKNSVLFTEKAMSLCDETEQRPEENRYRYVMEGTWFFGNYEGDRGTDAAESLVRDYILPGKIGLCAGVAGNHTQVYGLEEMCRGTYGRESLRKRFGIDSRTMSMIDNNGMSWGLVQPFAEAGYENIIFAPNQWNPRRSTVWAMDESVSGAQWNIEAGGGGSRMEVRTASGNPRVFFWEAAEGGRRMLVWLGSGYSHGTLEPFGFSAYSQLNTPLLTTMEGHIAQTLPRMEAQMPYDIWLQACYLDDQEPDMHLTDVLGGWNGRWKWPRFETLGNPDLPFDLLRSRFADQIPVLRGDITGGWYQHPVAAPDLLSDKFAADRLLTTAEKLSALAALTDPDYAYPAARFDRAWEALLLNDEHSYGTSGYQGRRVYETWLQHRDWIDRAHKTAREETDRALRAIASRIRADEAAVLAFNPTGKARTEIIRHGNAFCRAEIPPMGYALLPISSFLPDQPTEQACPEPPVIENDFYRIRFDGAGGMISIWDKTLLRELVDSGAEHPANCFLYTKNNHSSFVRPARAAYTLSEDADGLCVTARMEEPVSGAEVIQQVRLCRHEKKIEIDNRILHIHGLYNSCRYDRYAYYAFPFAVDHARRICHMNGCEAEYGADVTGHGTDVYMASADWCCAENGQFGVGMVQLDSELVEFDHIHPDKTDFGEPGEGAGMYFYLANDWLQMHSAGGSHMNLRFRYVLTSYEGDHRAAHLDSLADRSLHPTETVDVPAQDGPHHETSRSFAAVQGEARLLTLKRAQDGNGVILRLYGEDSARLTVDAAFFRTTELIPCSVCEEPLDIPSSGRGFHTFRLPGPVMRTVESSDRRGTGTANVPIGAVYTGLVGSPRAIRGENDGHLYLLWGRIYEEDLSHYELYRSAQPGFTPDETTLAARVEPEDYCVGRYVDEGLENHTTYYYRVRAVDREGRPGPFSPEFGAITREEYSGI